MAEPYLGEVRIFGGNFAPSGWALCNGQILSIQQNTALFSLLGTTYGGNGVQTFGLPNLQGTLPLHWGQAPSGSQYVWGQTGGTENVTLIATQMPQHNHQLNVNTSSGTATSPSGAVPAVVVIGDGRAATPTPAYAAAPNSTMLSTTIGPTGGSQPHNNMQPYLCLTFIIALQGIYPSRS